MYPDKNIDIKILSFNCDCDELIKYETVELFKYKRAINLYDFIKTNFEWAFLDNVSIAKSCSMSRFATTQLPRKLCSISCGKYRLKLVLERKN